MDYEAKAREVAAQVLCGGHDSIWVSQVILAALREAVEAEREAIAKMIEDDNYAHRSVDVAYAIRARSGAKKEVPSAK